MASPTFLTELLSVAGEAAYDWDLEADRINWFGACARLFGNTPPPSTSQEFYNIIHSDDRHLIFGADTHAIDREFRLRRPDGRTLTVHEHGVALYEGNRLIRQQGLLRLVEIQAEEVAGQKWPGRDPLTGCLDRNGMLAQIQKAFEVAKMENRAAAYLTLGIDKMSFVNEAVGMEAGDALLCGVARRLGEILPARAYVGRVGGDMFGILLNDPLARDFPALAERLLQNFRHQPILTSIVPVHITVSIGAVALPSVARNAAEAMIFAEQALHYAQQRGRDLFVEYVDSPERMQENRQILEISERVKHALKHNGLRLVFQPIVDAKTHETMLYEALVRIFDDKGNMIPAAQFVPVIEQMGLAYELDRQVLSLAISELEQAPNLNLAINVSGLTAAQADWPDYVRRMLGSRRSIAERLVVEITETAAIVDVTETRRFVDSLRALGGRVALDDFGAGFTSIRHLRTLALSIMKIDRDLLNDIVKDPEQQHLVRMLLEIARGMGLKTVAEGVETADVADWLRNEQVDMLQGYYFGKPSADRPWLGQKSAGDTGAAIKAQVPPHAETKTPLVIRVASSI